MLNILLFAPFDSFICTHSNSKDSPARRLPQAYLLVRPSLVLSVNYALPAATHQNPSPLAMSNTHANPKQPQLTTQLSNGNSQPSNVSERYKTCDICLDAVEDALTALTSCCRLFTHASCLAEWARVFTRDHPSSTRFTCPQCRIQMDRQKYDDALLGAQGSANTVDMDISFQTNSGPWAMSSRRQRRSRVHPRRQAAMTFPRETSPLRSSTVPLTFLAPPETANTLAGDLLGHMSELSISYWRFASDQHDAPTIESLAQAHRRHMLDPEMHSTMLQRWVDEPSHSHPSPVEAAMHMTQISGWQRDAEDAETLVDSNWDA